MCAMYVHTHNAYTYHPYTYTFKVSWACQSHPSTAYTIQEILRNLNENDAPIQATCSIMAHQDKESLLFSLISLI